GTALALVVGLRREVAEVVRELDRRRIARHLLELVPAGAAAFLLERPIEQRLGSPRSAAASQAIGATLLALADRRAERRSHADARPLDGLLIRIAQAGTRAPASTRAARSAPWRASSRSSGGSIPAIRRGRSSARATTRTSSGSTTAPASRSPPTASAPRWSSPSSSSGSTPSASTASR